ncbi:MAG: glycosyl hydrolase [Microscillaceae bacterium]|nr:glycosyl hydrolase [Microscillaceae bacterium]
MFNIKYFVLFALLYPFQSPARAQPADPKASRRTTQLYQNLRKLSAQGIMFGHQDDLAYGIGWKYNPGGSDVKYTTGEYPAVFGWDLGHLELDSPLNIDSVPFAQIRKYIRDTYQIGLVNTISWHLHNPVTGESSWSKLNSFQAFLQGGEKHAQFLSWLDKLANFLNSLKSGGGKIPVILRLYHEHNGSWFWWGRDHSSPDEYKQLWRITVDYLQFKGVHHVLYAYSPDKFSSELEYLDRYPGDNYVDILGFDAYHRNAPSSNLQFIHEARQMAQTVAQLAEKKQKLAAWTETGLETIPVANWWTEVLLPIVKDIKLSYVLVWRNGRTDHFYAPYPGQQSALDFKKFYQTDSVFFEKKTTARKLYKSK